MTSRQDSTGRTGQAHDRGAVPATLTPLLAALLLAGCAAGGPGAMFKGGEGGATPAAAMPELTSADGGPAAATAVIENAYTIDGAILPVVRGSSRTGTRADMRRSDASLTFGNSLLNAVAGDRRSADIVRVDRRLVWTLDPARRLYTECPLTGCATPGQKPAEERRPEQQSKPAESDCPVTVRTNELKVVASGERKTVNGFATERYQIGWTVELEDRQGRRNANRVTLELWNTPEAGAVREVQQITEAYQRRYASALNSGDNPIGRYVPREVLGAMSGMMKNIDARGLAAWGAELRKVHGYPILTNMAWTSDGAVCSDSARGGNTTAPSLSSLMGGLMGNKPAGAGPSAPLVSYTSEVKTLAVRPVSDSLFVPPADYQRK